MKKTSALSLCAVLLVTLSACAGPSLLQEAYESCEGTSGLPGVTFDEDHDVITINGAGRPDNGSLTEEGLDAYASYECLQREIGIPQYVQDEIGSTTSLQGRQSAEWDEVSASWSYHPNNGLNITIRIED